MSKLATKEYTLKMRERYGAMKTKSAKGRVLDDFCETTGVVRKHAIKVGRAHQTGPVVMLVLAPGYGLNISPV